MGRKIAIISIFLISLLIRTYKLGESPRSVNWDEAALGYNAYALLKTGHDEFGKYFPLSLQSFDDYKPALYSYFSVLPIKILGLNDVSTRMTSAIFGALLCLIITILTSKITKNTNLGLIAGILLCFEPWAIHFSRIAFEANLGTVLMYVGATTAIVFEAPYFAISFGVLSMYGYHAQRVVALPIIFLLILLKPNKYKLNEWYKFGVFGGILLLPLVLNFVSQPITARFTATSVFKLAPFVPMELTNKYSETVAFLNQFIGRYLAYFSPANLFVRGSSEPVLKIPTLGMLNQIEFLFWAIGLVYLIRNWKQFKYLLIIMFFAPLPGAITWNWFSTVRTLSLYPIFSILTAIGIFRLNKFKYIVLVLCLPFWVYSIANEISYSPVENYGEFQPGFEESVPFVLSKSSDYKKILVDSPQAAPYIFYNFYGKLDPHKYITQKTNKGTNAGTEKGYTMDKIEFRNIFFEKDSLDKTQIIAGTAVSIKDGTTNTKDFFDPKGYVSVRVYIPK